MVVLLTNDDGVYADGLQVLREEFERTTAHEVYVVAPERERSASGHAITLHKPLHVNPVIVPGSRVPMWSVNGTPADCTKVGVMALVGKRPDLVISGVNRGSNLGTDILYSGTVSAAIEGTVLGVPSLSVSLRTFDDAEYSFAARFTVGLAEHLLAAPLAGQVLLNVNIPALEPEKFAGVAITSLGVRRYKDVFHQRTDPRGKTYYWLAGVIDDDDNDPGTDIHAVRNNMISITPLHLDLTNYSLMPVFQTWVEGLQQLLLAKK